MLKTYPAINSIGHTAFAAAAKQNRVRRLILIVKMTKPSSEKPYEFCREQDVFSFYRLKKSGKIL